MPLLAGSKRDGRKSGRPAWLSLCVALAAGVSALLSISPAAGADAVADVFMGDGRGGLVAADADRLIAKANVQREIRVIVELRGTFRPEGRLSLFGAANQRAAIADLQGRILKKAAGARNVRQYRSVPMVAMTVSAERLPVLLKDWDVKAVYEDVAVPPTLDTSVPLIRADVTGDLRRVNDGKGWAVAVLDTGVQRDHIALRRKIVSEACYSTTNGASRSLCPGGAQSSTARGAGSNCRLSIAGCEHGTHVAGIAVGNPRGAGSAYKGVARKASLIPIQVFSRFTGAYCGYAGACVLSYTSDQIEALERVNELASTIRIGAVNLSLGGGLTRRPCKKNPLRPIVRTLRSKGIAVVIAAGNGGADGRVSSPGCIPEAVTVASTDKTDNVSSFSNFARLVDVAAPGGDITSAYPYDTFASLSGTSMAAPHVAGAWTLLRHRFPKASHKAILRALRCSGTWVTRNGVSKPRIDVYNAFLALRRGACTG